MSSIKNTLKQAKASENLSSSDRFSEMLILSALKRCFYAEHKPKEEAKMVLAIQNKNGESLERTGLHASAMLHNEGFCYREQVLSLFYKMSQGEELPLNVKCIFEEGNAIHEKWQRLFIRGGLGAYTDMDNTQFIPKYDLSFTPDAILEIGQNKYICEIKSMNSFAYSKSNSHPTGRLQCLFYQWLTGIHKGFVLMEDKNTQDFKIEVVCYDSITEKDKEKLQIAINHLEEIQKYKNIFLAKKSPPKRCEECSTKGLDCPKAQNCAMRDACFNVGIGRVKLQPKTN